MTYLPYVQIAGGFIYLLMGADLLVRGSVALARRARIAPGVVAFTVVAFGTSLPELMVSVRAALDGLPGLAMGNVVGSNIANVLLVAGAAALVHPLARGEGPVGRDTAIMMAVSVLFLLLCLGGELGRGSGVLLLVVLAVVGVVLARDATAEYRDADRATPVDWALGLPSRIWLILLFLVAGLVGLPIGARLVVEAASEIALQLGVTETVVGLTLIAFSTSLPELVTTVMAAVQRRTDVAVGTVIGSNTLNILAIMGAAAVVSPSAIPVSGDVLLFDLPVMLASSFLLSLYVWRDRPLARKTGVLCTGAYVLYVLVLFAGVGG